MIQSGNFSLPSYQGELSAPKTTEQANVSSLFDSAVKGYNPQRYDDLYSRYAGVADTGMSQNFKAYMDAVTKDANNQFNQNVLPQTKETSRGFGQGSIVPESITNAGSNFYDKVASTMAPYAMQAAQQEATNKLQGLQGMGNTMTQQLSDAVRIGTPAGEWANSQRNIDQAALDAKYGEFKRTDSALLDKMLAFSGQGKPESTTTTDRDTTGTQVGSAVDLALMALGLTPTAVSAVKALFGTAAGTTVAGGGTAAAATAAGAADAALAGGGGVGGAGAAGGVGGAGATGAAGYSTLGGGTAEAAGAAGSTAGVGAGTAEAGSLYSGVSASTMADLGGAAGVESTLSAMGSEVMATLSPGAMSEISAAFLPTYQSLVASGMPAAEAAMSIGSVLAEAGAAGGASMYSGLSAATMAELSGSAIGSLGGSGAGAAGGAAAGGIGLGASAGLLAIPAILFAIGTKWGFGGGDPDWGEQQHLQAYGEEFDRQLQEFGAPGRHANFDELLAASKAGTPSLNDSAKQTLDKYIYYTLNGKMPWSVSTDDTSTGPLGGMIYRIPEDAGSPLAYLAIQLGRMPTLEEARAMLSKTNMTSVSNRTYNPADFMAAGMQLGGN